MTEEPERSSARRMMDNLYGILDSPKSKTSPRPIMAALDLIQLLSSSQEGFPIDTSRVLFKIVVLIGDFATSINDASETNLVINILIK